MLGRSREGAWIEIHCAGQLVAVDVVAPARERGLKLMKVKQMTIKHCRSREGAWIEICPSSSPSSASSVAPARERGLKCLPVGEGHVGLESLPRGSVD